MFMLLDYNLDNKMAVIDTNDGVVEVLTSDYIKGIVDNRPDIYISGIDKSASGDKYSVKRMPLPFTPYGGKIPVKVISKLDITKQGGNVTCRISYRDYFGENSVDAKKTVEVNLLSAQSVHDLVAGKFVLAQDTKVWYENVDDDWSYQMAGKRARYKFGDEFPYFEEVFPDLRLGDLVWVLMREGYIPVDINK